jgi:hypothetical protein
MKRPSFQRVAWWLFQCIFQLKRDLSRFNRLKRLSLTIGRLISGCSPGDVVIEGCCWFHPLRGLTLWWMPVDLGDFLLRLPECQNVIGNDAKRDELRPKVGGGMKG